MENRIFIKPGHLEYSKDGYINHERVLIGKPVSPGTGYGRPCFYKIPIQKLVADNKNNQLTNSSRIKNAFTQLGDQLGSLASMVEDEFDHDTAEIFRAQRMICDELQSTILSTVTREQITAIDAVENCFNAYSDYFRGLSDRYLRERATDFAELKKLLLDLLTNTEAYLACREYDGCQVGECVLKNDHILVGDELTASVIIKIKKHTKGIITGKCGNNSHAAVIARSLRIPVISDIKDPASLFDKEDNILMDGETGEIVINPDQEKLKKYTALKRKSGRTIDVVEPVPRFTVLADIDLSTDVLNTIRVKADGIGLYRTEFEILANDELLSEKEQVSIYETVIRQMPGKPVYFRLFDLGSDKTTASLEMEKENNPALGCRGARFLLTHPELLQEQARALAKVSQISPINVIYPMISSLEEFLELKSIFLNAISRFKNTGIRHGIMFEVPSACINAEQLYKVIDFGRIGSNDLIQYLYALDRTSDDSGYLKLMRDPAIWKIISDLVSVARKAGKPLELCGSLADIPDFIPALIKTGITTISTHPENISAVRKAAITSLRATPD